MSFLGMDIGWGELLVILIVGLLVVGPEKLPAYARKTARFVRNFQKVTTNLTGQISKAMNLEDEEEGKASNFKKDLIEVKKSLEKDMSELKATLDAQARDISETMESGTKEAGESLEKNAKEISETLSARAVELKTTLDAQAQAVSETIGSGINEVSAAASGSTPGMEQPGDAQLNTPPARDDNFASSPPPNEAEVY